VYVWLVYLWVVLVKHNSTFHNLSYNTRVCKQLNNMYTVKGNVVRARETCDIMVHWPPLFCDTRANLGLATYPNFTLVFQIYKVT